VRRWHSHKPLLACTRRYNAAGTGKCDGGERGEEGAQAETGAQCAAGPDGDTGVRGPA
jgi:hypothetical protein